MKKLLTFSLFFLIGWSIFFPFVGCDDDSNDNAAVVPFPDNAFKNQANWTAFNAGDVNRMVTKGYYGAASDGRYIYYAPCRDSDVQGFHGRVLRYDTQGSFTALASYDAYDAGNTDGLKTMGFAGAVFAGTYVYFVPYANVDNAESVRHARVLRYNTQSDFNAQVSWEAYDASQTPGIAGIHADKLGYDGAIYDGTRYIYFVPYGDQNGSVNVYPLRYDTQTPFKTAGSWKVYNISNTDGLNTRGYYGAAFDGRYIYYVPFCRNDGGDAVFHGLTLRYDTTKEYTLNTSWEAFNAGNIDNMKTVGYKGAVFDGRYIYYVPFRDAITTQHCRVLRYDTTQDFKTEASWCAYDASNIDGMSTVGYVGAEFDGRYIYFIPYQQGPNFHANVLRYDTTSDFKTVSSWSAYYAGGTEGMNTKGYKYSTKQGDYIYFVPYNNNTGFSGIVLRYKTS